MSLEMKSVKPLSLFDTVVIMTINKRVFYFNRIHNKPFFLGKRGEVTGWWSGFSAFIVHWLLTKLWHFGSVKRINLVLKEFALH